MLTINLDCATNPAPEMLTIAASRAGRIPHAARLAYYAAMDAAADAYGAAAEPRRHAHYARLYHRCAGGALADAVQLRNAYDGALDLLLAARFATSAVIAGIAPPVPFGAGAAPAEPPPEPGPAPDPIELIAPRGAPEFHCHSALMQAHSTASVPPPPVIAIAYLAAALPEPWNPSTPQPERNCPVDAADDTFDGKCKCWTHRPPQSHTSGALAPNVYWRCAGGAVSGTEPDGLIAAYDRAVRALFAPAMDSSLIMDAPPYTPQTNPGSAWTPPVNRDHPVFAACAGLWNAYRAAAYRPPAGRPGGRGAGHDIAPPWIGPGRLAAPPEPVAAAA